MTIKQYGGVFGRNPTFNDVTIEGELTFDGDIDIKSDLKIDGDLEVTGTSKLTGNVGVGKSSGSNALEVQGESLFGSGTDGLKLTYSGGSSTGIIDTGYTSTGIEFRVGNVKKLTLNSSGNLEMNSGSGIDFSATAGTGTSELLDDYEEGEFVVAVTPVTSGSVVMNGSFDTGTYIKVGHLVTVTGFIVVSSVSSPVGLFKMNLPITPAASTERAADAAASVAMNNVVSANCADFVASVNENDPFLYVQLGNASSLQNDSAQELQANTYIAFSATYRGA